MMRTHILCQASWKDFAKAAAAKKDGKQNMGTELLIMNY
jgi:hypothetical protein